eukprot:scaffold5022_cov158-Amphora_coffeaeformis.AAC.3
MLEEPKEDIGLGLVKLMESLCSHSVNEKTLDPAMIAQVSSLLGGDDQPETILSDESQLQKLRACFDICNDKIKKAQERQEFELIEEYVRKEQVNGKERRAASRKLATSEDKRLAAELASLKEYEVQRQQVDYEAEIQRKVHREENAYMKRKMILSKAAHVAIGECREHFARARTFMQTLHQRRQVELYREYKSGLFFQQLSHELEDKDSRVRAYEAQIAYRVYQKKIADSNEYHMTQNLEEAQYLEQIVRLLDGVQESKERAARKIMEQQVRHLRVAAGKARERQQELELFYASAKLEMAKLVAENFNVDMEDGEIELSKDQLVERLERRKGFEDNGATLSISELYDEVLWSVAASILTWSSTDSNTYSDVSSDDYEENDDEDEKNALRQDEVDCDTRAAGKGTRSTDENERYSHHRDDSSYTTDNVANDRKGIHSPIGHMQIRQLNRDIRAREKVILDRHKKEIRNERKVQREEMKALKKNHEQIINDLMEKSFTQRNKLREGIKQRMNDLRTKHEEATEALRLNDLEMMHNGLHEEDRRLADAKESSFADAQALISAQVFHEVRNALSSVVAMSEMASSVKDDETLPQETKDASIDDMLDQSTEVVNYALQTLNNVLDLSKIKSSSMKVQKKEFDVQDMVSRCTMMQKSKAVKAKMSFKRGPRSYIVNSDLDITMRIMVNLISNAVKFTKSGGIKPFVWTIEEMQARTTQAEKDGQVVGDANGNVRQVAVGVADTGPGLDPRHLEASETGVLGGTNTGGYSHGASNSGFGLHLCQLLAHSLGTKLQLSKLEDVEHLLNEDLTHEIEQQRKRMAEKSGSGEATRFGTVLYFTLDIRDGNILRYKKPTVSSDTALHYAFRPWPSPNSKTECFRVLVADDVLMLRKGLVNAIISLFRECPVAISTACTAEDLLRATAAHPYDLVISDNLFHHDATAVKTIAFKEEKSDDRECLMYDPQKTSRGQARVLLTDFFKSERFTVREGDGEMLGIDALIQLSQNRLGKFPKPILMLLSGHKIEIPDEFGIIVAQKPLKQSELASLLEANAKRLLETNNCCEVILSETDSSSGGFSTSSGDLVEQNASLQSLPCLVNQHGARIFLRSSE